jgi:hypothetical protein
MWLKAYKSIEKLFDYGIMGQPLNSGASLAVELTFSFMHLLLLSQLFLHITEGMYLKFARRANLGGVLSTKPDTRLFVRS